MTQQPFSWMNQTAGRSGASYIRYVNDQNFDPWTNLDSYLGPGGSQSAAAQQAFAYTNQMARGMGYADGSQLPPEQKRRLFLANLERTRQQWADMNRPWEGDAASRLESTGWSYQPGWGLSHGGQSWELQNPTVPSVTTVQPGKASQPVTSPNGVTTYRWRDGSLHNTPEPGSGQNPAPVVTQPNPTPVTGGGSGLTAAQKAELAADPAQAYRYMMQQLGYSPDAPGMLGNFLRQKFQPLLEARMAAEGLNNGGPENASYLDQIDQIVGGFGSGLAAKGGNFFGEQAAFAKQAAGSARPYLDQLSDQSQAVKYLNQLASLQYAGVNPLIQQATADQLTRAGNQYGDYSFAFEGPGLGNIDPFTQWLMQQQNYRGIFGY